MNDSDLRRDYDRAIMLRESQGRGNCLAAEALETLAAGEGSERDRLTTLDHVMGCPHCRSEFELLRAIHTAGAERRAAPARKWYPLAAAIFVVVALTVFTVNRDSTRLRGDAVDDALPVLVSPSGLTGAASIRRFIWQAYPNAAQYRIEILEPGGRIRAAASVFDTTWSLPDSVALIAGETLQWTIEAILPDARRVQSSIASFQVP